MIKKTTTKYCDVCEKEMNKNISQESMSIVFTTEQNEGRPVKPYLTMKDIDICETCKNNVLKGNIIFGSGAMGYNQFWFKGE